MSKLRTVLTADEIKIVFSGQKFSKKIIHPIINRKNSVNIHEYSSDNKSNKNNFLDPTPTKKSKHLCCLYGNTEMKEIRNVMENKHDVHNVTHIDTRKDKNDNEDKSYACLSFPSNQPVTFSFILVR
jgi:hypothetical protein